jgi:hypothetical protein
MTKKEYALSIYRSAALKSKKATTGAERKELIQIEKAQTEFEAKVKASATSVMGSMMTGR